MAAFKKLQLFAPLLVEVWIRLGVAASLNRGLPTLPNCDLVTTPRIDLAVAPKYDRDTRGLSWR